MNENNASGTNTILIVIVLIAVVIVGVWIASRGGLGARTPENDSVNVGVEIPTGGNNNGGSDGGGTGGNY